MLAWARADWVGKVRLYLKWFTPGGVRRGRTYPGLLAGTTAVQNS